MSKIEYMNHVTEDFINGKIDEETYDAMLENAEEPIQFMNLETGECLTKTEMLKQFAEEYDGGDPTNGIDIWNYYKELEV